MIKYHSSKIGGVYTEGFEATFENQVLRFSKGAIGFFKEEGEEVFNYETSFSFNVSGDPQANVMYNVFLTVQKKVLVQRVETFTNEPQPVEVEPGDELLHLLSSFIIPANSMIFDIDVYHIERVTDIGAN